MTEFQAVLGLSQLNFLNDLIKKRIELAKLYNNLLKDHSSVEVPQILEGEEHTFQTYHIVLNAEIKQEEFIIKLKQFGIEANLGAQAINCLQYYKSKYGFSNREYPNASTAYQNGVALPVGFHVTEENVIYISECIKKILDKRI